MVAEADKVVTRFRSSAHHTGSLFGIAATGKYITITGILINRLEGSQVGESWFNWDQLEILQQMGLKTA